MHLSASYDRIGEIHPHHLLVINKRRVVQRLIFGIESVEKDGDEGEEQSGQRHVPQQSLPTLYVRVHSDQVAAGWLLIFLCATTTTTTTEFER